MLSYRERKTLREIQHRLLADDPDLEWSFRVAPLHRPLRRRWHIHVAVAAVSLFALVMLLLGSPGGALGIVVAAGLAWLLWFRPEDNGPRKL